MKISLCYIVKNEAKNLPSSLASACKAVDEIIVVDTGSVDNTKEIAQKYGAKIYDFTWCDDFAAARNFALARTTGDIVLFLDADERFAYPHKAKSYIRKFAKEQISECMAVPLVNVDADEDLADISHREKEYVIRIWQNRENFRYHGIVHETLYKKDEAGRLSLPLLAKADDDLLLIHTGYDEKIYPRKVRYYLSMIHKEMQEHGCQPLTYRYLADCYYGLQDYQETVNYVKKALDHEKKQGIETLAGRSKLYIYWLEAVQHLDHNEDVIIQIAREGLTDTSKEKEKNSLLGALWHMALNKNYPQLLYDLLSREKKYSSMLKLLGEVIHKGKFDHRSYKNLREKIQYESMAVLILWRNGRENFPQEYKKCLDLLSSESRSVIKAYYDEGSVVHREENTEMDRYLYKLLPFTEYNRYKAIVDVRYNKEQIHNIMQEEVTEILEKLQGDRYNENKLQTFMLTMTYLQASAAEQIELLNHIYKPQDAAFLADSLGAGRGLVYIYYAKRAEYPQNDTVAYLAAERYEAVVEELMLQHEILKRINIEAAHLS